MGRPRFQRGHVTDQGANWRGEFYIQEVSATGEKRRVHKSVVLGQRSKMTKTEAKKKLAEIILAQLPLTPDGSVTLRWFVEQKWLPIKQARWKASTHGTNVGIIENQVLGPLGSIPLSEFDKARLQLHLNNLAKSYSYSVVQHTHSFIRGIFEEALEADLLVKNPARSLDIPRVDRERVLGIGEQFFLNGKLHLTLDQLRALLAVLRGRDRCIVMLAGLCAMRPGEIFGLDWSAYTGDNLVILHRVYRGKIDSPKTEASMAVLPVPNVVREALDAWKSTRSPKELQGYVFNSRNGTPVHKDNFLRRVLALAGSMAGIPFIVTFQTLRRTWATHAPSFGAGLKEVETVLRHSASLNFTVGTYQQAIRGKVLEVMNGLADAVASDLPEISFERPAEPKKALPKDFFNTSLSGIGPELKKEEFLPQATTR